MFSRLLAQIRWYSWGTVATIFNDPGPESWCERPQQVKTDAMMPQEYYRICVHVRGWQTGEYPIACSQLVWDSLWWEKSHREPHHAWTIIMSTIKHSHQLLRTHTTYTHTKHTYIWISTYNSQHVVFQHRRKWYQSHLMSWCRPTKFYESCNQNRSLFYQG